MTSRERLGDSGAETARKLQGNAGREIRDARRGLGMSQADAARSAGISDSQLGRIERGELGQPTFEQVCRAGRAVGLEPSFVFYPAAVEVRDIAQLGVLDRFERLLGPPLVLRREVPLPGTQDQRAWDGRIHEGARVASIEGESKLFDLQALSRRIGLKQRDDPGAGAVILVVNRTAHNRRVLAAQREALRVQFPLDGAAIAHELRRGRVPVLGGIILV
jgi:transcriptional regulator with XRE-family HTH domain